MIIRSRNQALLGHEALGQNHYERRLGKAPFVARLGSFDGRPGDSYRERMFAKGVYLGHHHGPGAKLTTDGAGLCIDLLDEDPARYNRVLWSYALKLILTLTSARHDALHLKGLAVSRNRRTILIAGRGGSGKTTLANRLRQHGYHTLSNTHCVLKGDYLWGVNTWVRQRDGQGRESYRPAEAPSRQEGILKGVVLYERNPHGEFTAREVRPDVFKAFMAFFGAGIANYDLKEDVADWFQSEPFEKRVEILSKEIALVDAMVNEHRAFYVSCDVRDADALESALNFFEKL